MSGSVDLSIIILAWNARELVLDCVASIQAAALEISYEVIVVDNGSTDGGAAAIRRQFPEVQAIALPRRISSMASTSVPPSRRSTSISRAARAEVRQSSDVVLTTSM